MSLQVWVDGKLIFDNRKSGRAVTQSLVSVQLPQGESNLLVKISKPAGPTQLTFALLGPVSAPSSGEKPLRSDVAPELMELLAIPPALRSQAARLAMVRSRRSSAGNRAVQGLQNGCGSLRGLPQKQRAAGFAPSRRGNAPRAQ